ncbi:hypothetical protein [Brevibacillus laterosporus]|uniref:hypothetical protein n=1 Tax=Brevibacillus laterosporus TaxID=1465 RepID=UPI003F586446
MPLYLRVPSITLHLGRESEQQINHKCTQRLMKLKETKRSSVERERIMHAPTPQLVSENLLNRQFHVKAPNEK